MALRDARRQRQRATRQALGGRYSASLQRVRDLEAEVHEKTAQLAVADAMSQRRCTQMAEEAAGERRAEEQTSIAGKLMASAIRLWLVLPSRRR